MPAESGTPKEAQQKISATGIDTEGPELDPAKIAEKWAATIPEEDRMLEWTPEHVNILLHLLVKIHDEHADLFSTFDGLGHLPESILNTLYDEEKKDDVISAFKKVISDPESFAFKMSKVKNIGEAGLPTSVSKAFQLIIAFEGRRPFFEVFKEILDQLEKANPEAKPIDIIKKIQTGSISPQGIEDDKTRREAAGILFETLWPEFAKSPEVNLYVEAVLVPSLKTKEIKEEFLNTLKIKFKEIFNEDFEGDGFFALSEIADEIKKRIVEKMSTSAQ